MEKKLISIISAIVITSFSLSAQDYEAKGDAAIKRGDYSTAIENYEAQLSYMKFKKVDVNSREYLMLEKKCSKATECKTLRSKAASIEKKLNVDFYDALSKMSRSKGDEAVVTWKANIKSLTSTYNNILSKFPSDANTKSLLASVSKYQPKIDQAYFDAYTMPEKWAAVQKQGTIEAYQAFIDEYPEGRFADLAYQAIHKQEDDKLWSAATASNTKESYESYIASMPRGAYVSKATEILVQIEEDKDFWETAANANSIEGYVAYLLNSPNGFNKTRAYANLQVLKAKQAKEKGQLYSCSSYLQTFRELSPNPVDFLLEQNIPIYAETSEGGDYSIWSSDKNYAKSKAYIESHPDGEHFAEIADYYAKTLADSWDFLPPNATQEQISYILSLAKDDGTRAYIQNKIKENKKIDRAIESSANMMAPYSGNSGFYGYENPAGKNRVMIYVQNKPEKMAPVRIYSDGKYLGNDWVKVTLTPGYHTINLEGWDYTNGAKYESHKDTPTHILTYVIKVNDGTSEQTFGMNCPGGGSFRSKKTFSVVGQVVGYTAIIGGAIAAAAIEKK